MPACPSCGKDYTPPAAFCPSCGHVLDRPDTVGASPTAPAGTSPAAPVGTSPTATFIPTPKFGDIGIYIARRFAALLVDIIVVGALLATLLYFALNQITKSNAENRFGLLLFGLMVAGALLVYFWLMEGLAGATLGKMLLALGVGTPTGRAGLGRSFVRNILRPIDLAIIGFVVATVTKSRRRIGDFAAGTIVAGSRLGALAPLIALLILGVVGWVDYAYADGLESAKRIWNAVQSGPAPIPTPAETAVPIPTQTAQPSPAPTGVPTVAPSSTPGAATPSAPATESSPASTL